MATGVTIREVLNQWVQYGVDKTGYVSDENPISYKSILRDLLDIRADEIRNALSAKVELSELMVETIDCIELKEVDRAECVCAAASGCYWLKSKKPIPAFLKIISVTGIVAGEENPRYTFIKWDRFQYIPQARNVTEANGRYWTIRETGDGAYIYIYGDRFIESIAISGIWENPIEVETFPKCGKVDEEALCNPFDVDFFTDAWLRKYIIAKSWQSVLPVKQVAERDSSNDDQPGMVEITN